MKATHIVILLVVAGAIAALFSMMGSFTQYNDIRTAKTKPGKYVQVIASVDTNSIQWDPIKAPGLVEFDVKDSTGVSHVVYHDSKPTDMEKAEKIVLKGRMDASGTFQCKDMLLKCPSKYKDEKDQLQRNIEKLSTN
jgi:cytochrome c-type biogenesis protein CcmE